MIGRKQIGENIDSDVTSNDAGAKVPHIDVDLSGDDVSVSGILESDMKPMHTAGINRDIRICQISRS